MHSSVFQKKEINEPDTNIRTSKSNWKRKLIKEIEDCSKLQLYENRKHLQERKTWNSLTETHENPIHYTVSKNGMRFFEYFATEKRKKWAKVWMWFVRDEPIISPDPKSSSRSRTLPQTLDHELQDQQLRTRGWVWDGQLQFQGLNAAAVGVDAAG